MWGIPERECMCQHLVYLLISLQHVSLSIIKWWQVSFTPGGMDQTLNQGELSLGSFSLSFVIRQTIAPQKKTRKGSCCWLVTIILINYTRRWIAFSILNILISPVSRERAVAAAAQFCNTENRRVLKGLVFHFSFAQHKGNVGWIKIGSQLCKHVAWMAGEINICASEGRVSSRFTVGSRNKGYIYTMGLG